MFKNPFSFNGRIRRTEFGISSIIYFIAYVIVFSIAGTAGPNGGARIVLIFIIPMLWFLWAQNAKRCHDRGNSGWYQIIPFYSLWMLFGDSDKGTNEYGPNPKEVNNMSQLTQD